MGKIEKLRNEMPEGPSLPSVASHAFQGNHFCTFSVVSEELVKKVILSMPQKSCDLDPMPSSLLHDCLDELVPIITQIINKSLTTAVVPQSFKHAIVKPLLKKSNLDAENLKNYRPVSNLAFLSKVLERVVLLQLLAHLENHDLFEPFQSAYRKCRSTETALVRVVNDLLNSSDKGHVTILSMLDLSAAFDTLDHEVLLSRLSTTFGLRGSVLNWFRSYLTGRTQTVAKKGLTSGSTTLKYGVPQGSVLGPVLFTMYTLPLSSIIRSAGINYHLFADDTQLYSSVVPDGIHRLALDMSDCISDIAGWMKNNHLKMNEDKTEIMMLGTQGNLAKVKRLETLRVADCDVKFVERVKNLGIFLDSTLSFEPHIRHVCKTLYLQLRRLGKIRPFLSVEPARKLAVAFILSRLDYCNALLAGLPSNKIAKLQRIQNAAARIILRDRDGSHHQSFCDLFTGCQSKPELISRWLSSAISGLR